MQVHADKGFEAKVSYEGTAQYPDSPNYVPSAYGPPEPIRPGYAKFKRQSQQRSARKKIGRKVEKEKKQKKITFKAKETVDDSSDLLTASSQNNYFKNKEEWEAEKSTILGGEEGDIGREECRIRRKPFSSPKKVAQHIQDSQECWEEIMRMEREGFPCKYNCGN